MEASNTRVLDLRLIWQLLLFDSSRNVLFDLSLDHLKNHLFMVGVYAASTLAPPAWIRASLLCLATITAEAGDRLGQLRLTASLPHLLLQLRIELGEFCDFGALLGNFSSLTIVPLEHTFEHLAALLELLSKLLLSHRELAWCTWVVASIFAVLLHR